jgi:tetratricopeptide (TPR) repeat protein
LKEFLNREDQVGSAAETAMELLDLAESVESFPGIWFSNGLDMNEVRESDGAVAWLALRTDGEGVLHDDESSAEPIRWVAERADALRITIGRETLTHRVRRLNVVYDNNEEPAPIIQFNGRVWYQREAVSAIEVGEHFLGGAGGIRKVKRERFVDTLLPMIPESSAGKLMAARLAGNVGRYKSAIADIKRLISAEKRPQGHLYFHLGEAYEGAGNLKKAKAAFEDCVSADKSGEYCDLATSRLAKLSED